MNPSEIGYLTIIGAGLVVICLAVPLVKRKIKRNIFYGYRVSIYALSDDDIWYTVNEMGGKQMICFGIGLIIFGIAGFTFGVTPLEQTIYGIALGTYIIFSLIYTLYKLIKLAHKMAREKRMKK